MRNRLSASRVAWLAILAVVWHALLPLAHAASARGDMASSSICTTGPAQPGLFKLPAGQQQEAPAVDLLKQCPLCATGAHCALPESPGRAFVPDARLTHVQASAPFFCTPPAAAWQNFSARAPPAHA